MPLPLLAAAIPAAVSVGAKYMQKPKKEDFEVDTTYIDKYIANLRGRQADRDVYHMAMRPQLRQIGAQGRKMQRGIGYATEKAGLTGSGIEAQQRLSAGRTTMGAMQQASEQATAAQLQESRRLGEQAEKATMQRGQMEAQAAQQYQRAKSQWGREMAGTAISGIGNIASAGLNTVMQQKQAFDAAKASGSFTGSFKDFRQGLGAEGYGKWSTTGAAYGAQLGREKLEGEQQGFIEHIIGQEGTKQLLDSGVSIEALYGLITKNITNEDFNLGAWGRALNKQEAGLTGSGIEAQQRLSAGRTTMGAMQEAAEKPVTPATKAATPAAEKPVTPTAEAEAAQAYVPTKLNLRKPTFDKSDLYRNIIGVNETKGKPGQVSIGEKAAVPTVDIQTIGHPPVGGKQIAPSASAAPLTEAEAASLPSLWGKSRLLRRTLESEKSDLYRNIIGVNETKGKPKKEGIEYKYSGDPNLSFGEVEATATHNVNFDEAVDAIHKLESDRGKDTEGLKKVEDNPKVTAIGEYQQNDIFYEDITTRMGFPEYDRGNPAEAKKAVRHYLNWVMEKEGFNLKQAIAAYRAGVAGSRAGKGKKYSAAAIKIMKNGA